MSGSDINSAITKDEIADSLRELGLSKSDVVMVHSSLSSMGQVEGGAKSVIRAFLDTIGSTGTLALPAFDFQVKNFDVRHSPSKMGAISEAGRKHPRAVRSWHPTHSIAAIGKDAEPITWQHIERGTVGVGSPLDRMAKMGGWVLLLGVTHTTNTTIHVGETYCDFPGFTVAINSMHPLTIPVTTPKGNQFDVTLTGAPGCSCGFDKISPYMMERGLIIDGHIGNAKCLLMRGADVIESTKAVLKNDPYALLCDIQNCICCPGIRIKLDQAAQIGLL